MEVAMYAVIATGGKQYRVLEGDIIDVEKVPVEEGGQVEFNRVLLVGTDEDTLIGRPLVMQATVKATLLKQMKSKKIIVFKAKRRKHYRRKNGHRQQFSRLRIDSIEMGGMKNES